MTTENAHADSIADNVINSIESSTDGEILNSEREIMKIKDETFIRCGVFI